MAEFHMRCSCGHEIKVEAKDRDEAVSKIQSMMDENAIQAHLRERHKGEPQPSVAQIHQMIAQNTVAA